VLEESLGTALAAGRFARVPILNGTNHDEQRGFVTVGEAVSGGAFVPVPEPVTAESYQRVITSVLGVSAERAAVIAAEYPPAAYPSPAVAFSALLGDANFACPALQMDRWTSTWVPTFAYEFNDDNAPLRYPPALTGPPVATHKSEFPYLADRYHLTAADHLGFGLSDTPPAETFSYTLDALAGLTAALLKKLGLLWTAAALLPEVITDDPPDDPGAAALAPERDLGRAESDRLLFPALIRIALGMFERRAGHGAAEADLAAELAGLLDEMKRSAPLSTELAWLGEPLTPSETRVLHYLPTHRRAEAVLRRLPRRSPGTPGDRAAPSGTG
jgi:hypothetical protein